MGCVASSPRSPWWTRANSANSSSSFVSSGDAASARRKRSSVPQHEFLSDREKALIDRTWRRLSRDPVGAGTEIFMRIFELAPGARQVFTFSSLPDEELVNDVVFRSHATRFMRAVDSVMANLDALDVIVIQNLVQLGRYHATTVKGFRCEYLDVFETAMTDVWLRRLGRRRFDTATRRAWVKIFRLITSRVNEGFSQQGIQSIILCSSPEDESRNSAATITPTGEHSVRIASPLTCSHVSPIL